MKMLGWLVLAPVVAWGCGVVEGDRITGKDFAAVHRGFAGLEPGLDLGPAPVAGSGRVFRWAELERLAKEHGIRLEADAEREVCIQRASQTLRPEMVQAVLTRVYEESGREAEVEVLDVSRTPLPLGELAFRLSGLEASGTWRGRLVYGDKRSIPVWARVAITERATGKALVAQRAPDRVQVERGETIRVEVRSGGVVLAFDAAAETSGHVGEAVTVRNPANGQRFRAVVEGKGKAGIRR